MTPKELEGILKSIPFDSLSTEELSSYTALLSVYEMKTRNILHEKRKSKTHFPQK